MVALFLAAALAAAPLQAGPAPQEPPPTAAQAPVALEDVVVTGRPLDQLISDFVGEVAEPNRRRGLARWEDRVCVGVANLRTETAQYLSDRISTVAADIGLETGGPGCTPNILVVAAADGDELAQALVDRRRSAFRMGGSGMDRGGDAFEAFLESDRPVRWWQLSMPTDSETGDRAVRLPGDCVDNCIDADDFAPRIRLAGASRLTTQIVDNLFRVVVIVDVDRAAGLSVLQLADYIAMVSLAQINPEADTSGYVSILNVFDDATPTLTGWDLAYLDGLYGAERNDQNRGAGRAEIESSIRRAHARARVEAEE
ncbi:MAG: hypothetical protein HYU62_14020 [Caulobacterales bacterium]|nr:hypothetical protein [Caulobacterales bacterium]